MRYHITATPRSDRGLQQPQMQKPKEMKLISDFVATAENSQDQSRGWPRTPPGTPGGGFFIGYNTTGDNRRRERSHEKAVALIG